MSELAEYVTVYAAGICFSSACCPKDMPPDEVVRVVNQELPTGLDHGWRISVDKAFAAGKPHPCPCEKDESRIHRLLVC